MTALEAYKKFELEINNMNTATNYDISEGEFILIYNDQQNKWFRDKFRGRSAIYTIDDVQQLIVPNAKITDGVITDRYASFKLPDNYFDYISSYALATRDKCTDRTLYTFQVKLTDIDMYLKDDNNKPSFEYQETPLAISQDHIQVYKTDFNIDSVFLTYYRFPISIDIEGYIRLDGTPSATIDPELNDQAVNEIIDWCVLEVQRVSENSEGFQLSNDRLNKQQ